MNKRILKLFNEAGFHQPEMERLGIEEKFEKFAELIVRECIKELENDTRCRIAGANRIVAKHFGVEE